MTKFGYDIDFIKQASAFIFTLSDQDRKYNKSIKDLDDYQNKKNAYIYRAWKITKECADSAHMMMMWRWFSVKMMRKDLLFASDWKIL